MSYKLAFITLFSCLLTACNQGYVCVQSEYITYEDLASYKVGTPDPKKECPDTGQRLIVRWTLPKICYKRGETRLVLLVRFGTGQEEVIDLNLHSNEGSYIYDLLNDDYFNRCGILTYKATVTVCGEVLDEWLHQIWTERITFDELTTSGEPAGQMTDTKTACQIGHGA